MKCTKCHNYEVSTERVEIGLTTCMGCAKQVKPVKGYMSWAHKTAPVIQITDEESFKDYRRYVPHGRNTGMGSGCHRVMSNSQR